MKMRYCWLIAGICLTLGCQKTETEDEVAEKDVLPELITQMQQCSRLYTTEYLIHKIVMCESNRQYKGYLFSIDLNKFGDRKIAIPIEATLKGYIDMSRISEKNIERDGKAITITLPDPEVMMTQTKIDHESVKEYVTGFRDKFEDKEISQFEAEGRAAIIKEIPRLGIEKQARESATKLLIPMLVNLGFEEEDIVIKFRSDFNPAQLKRLLN